MESSNGDLGPIDVVIIAFPPGAPMTGDAVPLLLDLVDRKIIRVLDATFIHKKEDGGVEAFEVQDLDEHGMGAFDVFDGASTGLFDDDDVAEAAESLEPGGAAVMLLYENRWAAPFVSAVRRNGGVPVAFLRIPAQHVAEALDAAEAAA